MIRTAALLLAAAALAPAAGPLDYARAEFNQAVAERRLNPASFRVAAEYSMLLPEDGFQISAGIIRGGSLRGLVYGLLTAAAQIRESGRLLPIKGEPRFALRGVRHAMTPADWQRPASFWLDEFSRLAALRFNRFHLLLDDEPLSPARLETLKLISAAARDRAIDLTVGLNDPDAAEVMRLLAECEAVRGVHVDAETAAYISGAVSEAGRFVVLETTRAIQPAVPVPLRVAVAPGQPTPACGPACSVYRVFPAAADAPPSIDGAGFEIQGPATEAWAALGYAISKAPSPTPTRRAPARRRPARRK